MEKANHESYFENYLNQKKGVKQLATESRTIRKLLGAKAYRESKDSRKLTHGDLKRMAGRLNTPAKNTIDVDNFLFPF
ncbi:MAG TPA: hypothetical protein VNZ49_03910 [Bacteroidia bacterium]|jgi:hypothetical protein|nr:hypothetical protein [Bacteroidia bacterium]